MSINSFLNSWSDRRRKRVPAGNCWLNHQEPVSNFSMEVLGSVHVAADAGGSGLPLKLKRFPDDVEKYVSKIYTLCLTAYQSSI
jgi:hypothetical protein